MPANDEAVPDYWPPLCTPRHRWRFLAFLRPVRAAWRRVPRLGKISLSTLVLGSAVLVVPAIGMGSAMGEATAGAMVSTMPSPADRLVVTDASPAEAASGVYAKGLVPVGSLTFGPGKLTSALDFTSVDPSLVLGSTGGCSGAIPAGVTLRITLTINRVQERWMMCGAGDRLVLMPSPSWADLGTLNGGPARALRAVVTVEVTPAGAAVPPGSFTLLEKPAAGQIP